MSDLKRLWHYVKCVVVLRREPTNRLKRKFKKYGKGTTVFLPARLSGVEGIQVGEDTIILQNSRLQIYSNDINKNPKIVIGNHCYMGYYLSILAGEDIVIGDDVLVASNVLITSENHSIDPESSIPYMDQPIKAKKVIIENGVWIGEKACILSGVTIGEKSIVGAGSVVTKTVPPYSIVAGNPARVIKQYDLKKHTWVKYNE